MGTQPLRIDIVSDVVCPWCIIGYKQVERALTLLPEPVKPPEADVWHQTREEWRARRRAAALAG